MRALLAANTADFDAWDAYVAGHPHGTHTHLSWWLEAHRRPQLETAVALLRDEGSGGAAGAIRGGAAIYLFRLPVIRQAVAVVSAGPLIDADAASSLGALLDEIAAHCTREGAVLLQFEAFAADMTEPLRGHFTDRRPAADPIWKLYHPSLWREFRVRLAGRTPDEIMAGFNQGTRRKIRGAQKAGVTIDAVRDEAGLREAWDIWCEDAQRQSYTPRPWEQVRAIYRAASQRDRGEVLTAHVGGQTAGFNFILHFGIGTYYLHGGFRSALQETNPNHILQYEAMCRAQKRGAAYYSLAAPGRDGLYQYKSGFGGEIVDNTRFCSVPLRRMRLSLLRPMIGQVRWMKAAKRWVVRGRGAAESTPAAGAATVDAEKS